MSVEITPQGTRGRRFPRGRLVSLGIRLNVAVYRLLRGRGMDSGMLLLTTVGARSGAERTVPLAYFPDGSDAWLIIASAGGDARHPAWYRNLAAHPERAAIEVGGRRVPVRAESLHGADREERWRRITAKAKNFAEYQRSTDREIPLIRLTPREPAG
ncbi:MAG TPA: nitroreductase/quinone reductase family protein [Candidatus Dormibacteraeota bacterium]|nr:nitroreductase/quinone reductase family protein [Candidatus Dormibacteraeota bacterium]